MKIKGLDDYDEHEYSRGRQTSPDADFNGRDLLSRRHSAAARGAGEATWFPSAKPSEHSYQAILISLSLCWTHHGTQAGVRITSASGLRRVRGSRSEPP